MDHRPELNLPIEQFAVPEVVANHYKATPTIRSVHDVNGQIHVRYEYCFNVWNDMWGLSPAGWKLCSSKIEE